MKDSSTTNENRVGLREAVKKKIVEQKLTKEELDFFQAFQDQSDFEDKSVKAKCFETQDFKIQDFKTRSFNLNSALVLVASLFFIGIVLSPIYLQQPPAPDTLASNTTSTSNLIIDQTLVNQIAYEVTKNHLKLKPLDVKTNSMDEVQAFFTLLDFKPIKTNFIEAKTRLLGGRYCSIKGITAAQIRYQDSDVNTKTLYQVPYNSQRFGVMPVLGDEINPVETFANGLKVELWVEKGLLMVLVGNQ